MPFSIRPFVLAVSLLSIASPLSAQELNACGAEKVQNMLGKKATTAVLDQIKKISGASAIRVLRPGMVTTMEFSDTRLNVSLGRHRLIKALACG